MDYEDDARRIDDLGASLQSNGGRADESHGRSIEPTTAGAPLGEGPSALVSQPDAIDPDPSGMLMADDAFASLLLSEGFGPPPVMAGLDRDHGLQPPHMTDLASAFLAALDAVDDRRFVTPPPPDPVPETVAPPVVQTVAGSVAESVAETVAPEIIDSASNDLFDVLSALAFGSTLDEPPAAEAAPEPGPEPRTESAPQIAGLLTMGERAESPAPAVEEPETLETPEFDDLEVRIDLHAAIEVEPAVEVEAAVEAEAAAEVEVGAAVEPEADTEPEVLEDLQEFVVFSLGDLRCVVPIRNVIEVGRIPDAAPVPNAPVWLHGLGNLRGQVLSLIDLRAFFGVGRIKPSAGRMVVLRGDSDEVTAGVMVDQVHQIVALSPSRFREAPESLPDGSTAFVWGACDYGNYTMIGLDVDGVLGVETVSEQAGQAL